MAGPRCNKKPGTLFGGLDCYDESRTRPRPGRLRPRRVQERSAKATGDPMLMRRNAAIVLLTTLLLAGAGSRAAQSLEEPNTAIPMRDGVMLRATVLRPTTGGPFPVLVYRTPYGARAALEEYTTFRHALERGYAVVVEDVRGRYASAGDFVPYQHEGPDGYDTIEWAATQPWSNGRVGTFGLSYPGAVQWLAAVESPPHLRAMVPAMTFSSYRNFFYAGGTFDLSWIEWIWDNIAPDVRVKHYLPGPRTAEAAAAAWEHEGLQMQRVVPLDHMAALRGIAPYYYEWLRHPPGDPWWDWADLTGKYDRTQAAVLNLSGWYDDNYGPEGATTNFQGLVTARGGRATDTALLIGPWVHGVESTQTPKAGERVFPDSARIDYDATVLDWMDHYLKGIDNGVGRGAPVRYYTMGADTWQQSAVWPPPATATPWYLGAATPRHPGRLVTTRPQGRPHSAFVSDPADPVVNRYAASGGHDYRDLADRADLLTFDSAPLAADTEITGPIRAELFISCDCRDLDLWVRLYDVGPEGDAWNQMAPGVDVRRASDRNGHGERRLLRPGQIYPITIDGPVTSTLFKRRHRIRIQVSGSFFPNFSRNLQTGEPEATSSTSAKATVTIHHDAAHASRVVLPVVAR